MKAMYITPMCETIVIGEEAILASSPDTTTLEGSDKTVDPSDARVKEEMLPSNGTWDQW